MQIMHIRTDHWLFNRLELRNPYYVAQRYICVYIHKCIKRDTCINKG